MKLTKPGKVAKKVTVSTNLFVKTIFMPNIDKGQTVISANLDKYSVCANKYIVVSKKSFVHPPAWSKNLLKRCSNPCL